jgi:quercetin dioxygenase-like cupin family protein
MAFILPKEDVIENNAFRRVLFTDESQQLVTMALSPSMNIGEMKHEQGVTIIVCDGRGVVALGKKSKKHEIVPGAMISVKPGTLYDLIADSKSWFRLLLIYSPPRYAKDLVEREKIEDDENEDEDDIEEAEKQVEEKIVKEEEKEEEKEEIEPEEENEEKEEEDVKEEEIETEEERVVDEEVIEEEEKLEVKSKEKKKNRK